MLRALVVLLLAANLLFFAFDRGWLDGFAGVAARSEREPQRMTQQQTPDAVALLAPQAASAAVAAAAASAAATQLRCLEAGPFGDEQIAAAEQALATLPSELLPAGALARSTQTAAGDFMIYIGRFGGAESQQRRRVELQRGGIAFEDVTAPPQYAPGVSLGRFDSREAAAAALQELQPQRGLRSGARIVELAAASNRHLLRIARADAALAARLQELGSGPAAALGGGFRPCAGAPAR